MDKCYFELLQKLTGSQDTIKGGFFYYGMSDLIDSNSEISSRIDMFLVIFENRACDE